MKKNILLLLVVIIGSIFIYQFLGSNKTVSNPDNSPAPPSQPNEAPQIVSTKPDPLNETIIPADQIIEITFNKSLQNAPEFKVRIEPKIDFKVELSQDRKTARILPVKPYNLGEAYTLYIEPDTKFDGVGSWGMDKSFHFRTIKYRGI